MRLGKAKRIRIRTADGLFSLNNPETMASMEGGKSRTSTVLHWPQRVNDLSTFLLNGNPAFMS